MSKPRSWHLGLVLAPCCACTPAPANEPAPTHYYPTPQGVACGDPSETAIRVWSRTDWYSWMHVRTESHGHPVQATRRVLLEKDFTATVTLDGLEPDTRYEYAVWFSSSDDPTPPNNATHGVCATAPRPDTPAPLALAWGGDLGGHDICRDAKEGYAIFQALDRETLDLFIGLGDMIYADDECSAVGHYGNAQVPGSFPRSTRQTDFWAHYRYNREDPGFRKLLASTAYVAIWDDHEVVNDFGPGNDTRSQAPYVLGASLMPIGRQAFLDYHPIAAPARNRLYRSLRWGRHVQLFILDLRQYRDAAHLPDTEESEKTMLGEEQRAWLEDSLARSDATWNILVSSVPIAIPSGAGGPAGGDGWAPLDGKAGYYRELEAVWRHAMHAGQKQLVFLTTDVHFATGFEYRPFPGEDFRVYEFTSGPLSAALYPRRALDPTFHPQRLYYYGPENPGAIKSYEDAKSWMNYGRLDVTDSGDMTVRIVNALGERVAEVAVPRSQTPTIGGAR